MRRAYRNVHISVSGAVTQCLVAAAVFFVALGADAAVVGYWRFDSGADGAVATSIPSEQHPGPLDAVAESVGSGSAPAYTADRLPADFAPSLPEAPDVTNSGALRFQAGNNPANDGGRLVVSDNDLLDLASFSFEMFVKIGPDQYGASLAGRVGPDAANVVGWALATGAAGELIARIDNDDGAGVGQAGQIVATDPAVGRVADGRWHHVAMTYDGGARQIRLYVDHKQVAEQQIVGPILATDGEFVIGLLHGMNAIGAVFDEARLSDQVLTPDAFLKVAAIDMKATVFDRHMLAEPCQEASIRAADNLQAFQTAVPPADPDCSLSAVQGWFEYEFYVSQEGWYQVFVQSRAQEVSGVRYGAGHDYIIDENIASNEGCAGSEPCDVVGDTFLNAAADATWSKTCNCDFKIGNVWLKPGAHRFRVQRYHWTGFHPLTAFRLDRVIDASAVAKNVRVNIKNDGLYGINFVRKGEPLQLDVISNGQQPTLKVQVRDAVGTTTHRTVSLDTPDRDDPYHSVFTLTDVATLPQGNYQLVFRDGNTDISERDMRRHQFVVVDTAPAAANVVPWVKPEPMPGGVINCATDMPPYAGGSDPHRVVPANQPRYRESGVVGFRQHRNETDPSWFAYDLPTVTEGQPYLLEVDYPDDALRTFAIEVRESDEGTYVLASGVDSGGEFVPTGSTKTHQMLYWPRSSDATPKVVLLNARDGRRAACTQIRFYSLAPSGLPPLLATSVGTRSYGQWFEEPDRWMTLFGANHDASYKQRPMEALDAVTAWAQTVRFLGGDTLSVTSSVYALGLHPSRDYNVAVTTAYDVDWLQLILLVAERYGLKTVVDVHPRADELRWPADVTETDALGVSCPGVDIALSNLLVDREGETVKTIEPGTGKGAASQIPSFNPVHERNQRWLMGFMSELTERYASYKALEGLSVRAMGHANPALHNFHSLDWGYGDYTVECLAAENPALDVRSSNAEGRYAALTGDQREAWIDWRTDKIEALFRRLVDNVRAAEVIGNRGALPPLRLMPYTFVSVLYRPNIDWHIMFPPPERFPDMGFDAAKLASIDGLTMVNAFHQHGRNASNNLAMNTTVFEEREDLIRLDQVERDYLIDRPDIGKFAGFPQGASFLFNASYFEGGSVGNVANKIVPRLALNLSDGSPYTAAHVFPAGRAMLERYALAVAEADAIRLIDGGNAYLLPGNYELIREFMASFSRLPATRFQDWPEASHPVRDPVTIRWLTGSPTYFYLVNREYYPVTVTLDIAGAAQVTQLWDGVAIGLPDQQLEVTLLPYQLRAFTASAGTTIIDANVAVPNRDRLLVEDQVNWLAALSQQAAADPGSFGTLTSDQLTELSDAADNASWSLMQGHYWEARSWMEREPLLGIYADIDQFPAPYAGLTRFSQPLTDRDDDGVYDYLRVDQDQDGHFTPDDCDDGNPAVHPGALETAFNDIDENCAGGDSTIRVIEYARAKLSNRDLSVEVVSQGGEGDRLTVEGYAPLSWMKRQDPQSWRLETKFTGDQPPSVLRVTGIEGTIEIPVTVR